VYYFSQGGAAYHFTVPDDKGERSYISKMREYAKRDGQGWRIAHNIGRAWIVKKK